MKSNVFLFLLGVLFLSSCQEEVWKTSEQDMQGAERKEVLWLIKSPDGGIPTKAVGLKSKYWRFGDTIRVKFLSSVNEEIQQKIKEYAPLWLENTCLGFKYVASDEEADVKIGFGTEEDRWISWSTIGTDCKTVPQDQPSLTYFWWEDDPEAVIKSEILKGIGLVLGLGFEHQNPNSTLTFKATADIVGEYNLTDEEAEVFKTLYSAGQTNYTEYDKSSVMMVSISRSLVSRPNMATNYNSELSENDKAFISKAYPAFVAKAVVRGPSTTICVISTNFPTRPGPFNRIVDWGDGTTQVLAEDNYYSHGYRGDTSEYVLRFHGDETAYKFLYFTSNVTKVDLSQAKSLESLRIEDSEELSELDISHNLNLGYIILCGTSVSELDVLNNQKLYMIALGFNRFSTAAFQRIIKDMPPYYTVPSDSTDYDGHFHIGKDDDASSLSKLCNYKGWGLSIMNKPLYQSSRSSLEFNRIEGLFDLISEENSKPVPYIDDI